MGRGRRRCSGRLPWLAFASTAALAASPLASCGARSELDEGEREIEPFHIECIVGLGNCDGVEGCETELRNDDLNCGACGEVCPEGRTCRAGHCALPHEVVEVDASASTNCALRGDGRVLCWGDGDDGALGDGRGEDSSVPVFVEGIVDAVRVRGRCALGRTGDLRCWGANPVGWLGGDPGTPRLVPIEVDGLPRGIADLDTLSCLMLRTGEVWCRGGNRWGDLGDGTTTSRDTYGPVTAIDDARQYGDGCVLRSTGQVWCWGYNAGKIWGTDEEAVLLPRRIPDIPPYTSFTVQIGACGIAPLAVDTDLRARRAPVHCWGGSSVTHPRDTPAFVGLTENTVSLDGYLSRTCAVDASGQVICWGGWSGERHHDPAVVAGLPAARSVAVGVEHHCAATRTGSVYCWGSNRVGQLGDGSTNDSDIPVEVQRPQDD
jgi:alpha-tubulin suppressor-like RCC1 family protein